MPARTVLLDTSFILALENKADPHHERAKALDRQLLEEGAELLLHRGIIYEIADGYSRLTRREKGLKLLEKLESEDNYRIEPVTDDLYLESLGLYRSRADKEWGLTDCTSFVLMRWESLQDALTADNHFRQAGFNALLLDPEPT